jgi:segregation and condensation protein B
MTQDKIKNIIEAALLAANIPLKIEDMVNLFKVEELIEKESITDALSALKNDYSDKLIEITEASSGYRMITTSAAAPYLKSLWELKPQRLSRAFYETLSLIAYRQPVTRGEIEEIRGVAVSPSIIKSLFDRDWVKIVGHKETLGRPALLATTKEFLDAFNLSALSELPVLEEIREIFPIEENHDLISSKDLSLEVSQNIH